eukprot:12407646-Alexandrium_andersonii.AAC.1
MRPAVVQGQLGSQTESAARPRGSNRWPCMRQPRPGRRSRRSPARQDGGGALGCGARPLGRPIHGRARPQRPRRSV